MINNSLISLAGLVGITLLDGPKTARQLQRRIIKDSKGEINLNLDLIGGLLLGLGRVGLIELGFSPATRSKAALNRPYHKLTPQGRTTFGGLRATLVEFLSATGPRLGVTPLKKGWRVPLSIK